MELRSAAESPHTLGPEHFDSFLAVTPDAKRAKALNATPPKPVTSTSSGSTPVAAGVVAAAFVPSEPVATKLAAKAPPIAVKCAPFPKAPVPPPPASLNVPSQSSPPPKAPTIAAPAVPAVPAPAIPAASTPEVPAVTAPAGPKEPASAVPAAPVLEVPAAAVSIKTHRAAYMAMMRAFTNPSKPVTEQMLQMFTQGGPPKHDLLVKWVQTDGDLETMSFDVIKDMRLPCCCTFDNSAADLAKLFPTLASYML